MFQFFIGLLLLSAIVGCNKPAVTEKEVPSIPSETINPPDSSGGPTDDPSPQIVSLGTGTALNRNFELFKITKGTMRESYVQWFPPVHQPGPVLIHMQPYYGISWSQNSVDNEWANRANATTGYDYQDVNGPLYDSAIPNKIHYQLLTPELVAEESAPYLLNNMGVLIVYGRFYAGGSIGETLQSVQLAFHFLSQQTTVDKTRIGIFGFSFGGFQALYGAAQASIDMIPKVGVAWAPLLDFELMDTYVSSDIPAQVTDSTVLASYNKFFDAYVRRIFASIGGTLGSSTNDFSQYNGSYISENLNTPFLLIHNEWDTLIPIQGSKQLVQAKPELVKGYWFPQTTTANPNQILLSHQMTEYPKYLQPASLFTQSYLLSQLMEPNDSANINLVYSSVALKDFFTYLRTQQNSGIDISLIKDQLLALTDDRIKLVDLDQQMPPITGAEFLSWALNIYWGLSLDPENINTYFSTNTFPSGFINPGMSRITASSTDPNILFSPSAEHLYRTCANTGCTDTETLLVFFPGSNGWATDFQKFVKVISDTGIPTLALQYENTNALNSLCVSNSKTVAEQNQCFTQARSDRVNGSASSQYVSSVADGIWSRLRKALLKLHWYQFLNADGSINTQKIIFGGFSQGSGMASWVGKSYPVKRVCQFAGTWDYTNDFLGTANSLAPAAWLSQMSQTSSSLFYGFSHQNDSMANGINYLNVLWNQLGMAGTNPSNFIALASNPSGQKIYSADTGGQCTTNAHSCTAADAETPIDGGTGEPVFKPAWRYTCLGL